MKKKAIQAGKTSSQQAKQSKLKAPVKSTKMASPKLSANHNETVLTR